MFNRNLSPAISRRGWLLAVALCLCAVVSPFMPKANGAGCDDGICRLAGSDRWLAHLRRDLLPYWETDSALGNKPGEFPTWRYFDGEVVDPGNLRDEFLRMTTAPGYSRFTGAKPPWRFNRIYIRMLSQQTYFYGVAYHLTGEEKYLQWAKAGVDYIIHNAYDEKTGGFAAFLLADGAKPDHSPAETQITSQDLAYVLAGPAFYYYLTRDPDVLRVIDQGERFIFKRYDERLGLLRWVDDDFSDPPDHDKAGQENLVAQLDQINAYLLTMAPIVPDDEREHWKSDLEKASAAVRKFYDGGHNVFWGRMDGLKDDKTGEIGHERLGAYDVDFGHTSKAFTMLYLAGRILKDNGMQHWALLNGTRVLKEAYVKEDGAWANGKNADGSLRKDREWWVYAELDQAAAVFGFSQPAVWNYLPSTYAFWFDKFVDHQHGDVWAMVEQDGRHDRNPKTDLWKSGYHPAEHCLVGYITSLAARRQPVPLYFAFKAKEDLPTVSPYYFTARMAAVAERAPLSSSFPGREKVRMVFTGVK